MTKTTLGRLYRGALGGLRMLVMKETS
jgi:hypothetical protein